MGDAYEKVRLKKQNARLRQENAEQAALLEEVRGDLRDAVRSFAECAESLSDRVHEVLAKLQPDTEPKP